MILSIASQKGGVGKTTTAISLAAGLAHGGKQVLLIDIDSQANSSKVLLDDYPDVKAGDSICATIIDRQPLPVRPANIANLDIVPAHILLSNTDVTLTTAIDHREARLKTQLDAIGADYEYVLVDCPPALSWLTINALTASRLSKDTSFSIHYPPLCPEWLFSYGYDQSYYLRALQLYWKNVHDDYYKPWPMTIIGQDSPEIERLKKIGKAARREIDEVARHSGQYIKR